MDDLEVPELSLEDRMDLEAWNIGGSFSAFGHNGVLTTILYHASGEPWVGRLALTGATSLTTTGTIISSSDDRTCSSLFVKASPSALSSSRALR